MGESTSPNDDVAEIIELVKEECSEVVHIGCKITRHGLHNHHPVSHTGNIDILIEELADLLIAISLLHKYGVVYAADIMRIAEQRVDAKNRYLRRVKVCKFDVRDFIHEAGQE